MSWNKTLEEISNISKIIKLIGTLSKIAGIITIFCYISGFIIINSYLSKYGLIAEEIFGAKYLSAGLLFLVIAGIFTINWWFLRVSPKIKEEYKDSKEKIKSKLYPLGLFVLTLWPLSLIFSSPNPTIRFEDRLFLGKWMNYLSLITSIIFILSYLPSWFFKTTKPWLEITSLVFFIITMIMLFLPNISIFFFVWAILLFLLLSSILPKKVDEIDFFTPVLTNSSGNYIISPIGSAFFFILAFGTIWFFGRFIYPRITPNIGGGNPIKVEILLRETLPISEDTTKSNIIKEAYLLHREQSSIILLIPNSIYGDKAIRLNDNEVRLMIPISETSVQPKKEPENQHRQRK